MASAAAKISFSCPHCDKVLKVSTRPAEGKKVKCPACGEVFVPEIDDDDGAAVQERPTLKSKGKASAKSDPDERPRSKKSRDDDDDDDDDDDAPKKKTRQRDDDEDDDEDEDEDDRPSKKKGKQKSSMMMVVLLVVLGGGFIFSLILVALAAFVWPGFLRTKEETKMAQAADPPKAGEQPKGAVVNPPPPPAGQLGNDLGSYVFPEAAILVGSNLKGMRDANQLEPMLKQIDALAPPNNPMPMVLKDLARNSDAVMMCATMPQVGIAAGPPRFMIMVLAPPDFVAKFRNNPKMGAEEKLGGRYSLYRPGRNDRDMPPVVVIPSDRVILMGEMADPDLIALLDGAARNPGGQHPAVKLSKMVDSSHIWLAMGFDDNIRQQLRGLDAMAKEAPQLASFSQAMQRANGATMSVNMSDATWKMQLNVDCASPDDANAVKIGAETLKLLMSIGLQAMMNQGKAGPPPAGLKDLDTLAFQCQANVASATMSISPKTITDLAALGMLGAGKGVAQPPKDFAKGDGFRDFGPGKDLPKFDGPTKDFPKPDGMMKKDFPKTDGFSKDKVGQPGGPSYTLTNLFTGKSDEKSYTFQQGKRVTVTMTSKTLSPKTNVNLYVLRGNAGETFQGKDESPGPNGSVTFIVPMTGVYRVRVQNFGPGTANSCIISIREE